jgi:two-component system cell cycle sensor histidine kinase/response regulator CckA
MSNTNSSETVIEKRKANGHPGGHGEWILVVDDDAAIREITCSILDKHGYRAITACDGADAIAVYKQNRDKVRAVLMDMIMPVMDGTESIQLLSKDYPNVKIIAVSGQIRKDKISQVIDNVQAFLPKPYTSGKLLDLIHEVLSTDAEENMRDSYSPSLRLDK